MLVTVLGAGVAGLTAALELTERGAQVRVIERAARLGETACSWCAGGMLAPWCEGESAPAEVVELGALACDWWARRVPGVARNGTLVVAAPRCAIQAKSTASRREPSVTSGSMKRASARLSPILPAAFARDCFSPTKDISIRAPRWTALWDASLVTMTFGADGAASPARAGAVLDCRGFAARDELPDLRGVRGEMVMLRTREIAFSRPIRFLHPRIPLYVVPRGEGLFMVGATMIESAARGAVTARSAIELLSAAYALHPAFGEAEIVETRADVRPAFPDNLPRVFMRGAKVYFNGLYRHGFLLSPAFAQRAAEAIMSDGEGYDENHRQRRRA